MTFLRSLISERQHFFLIAVGVVFIGLTLLMFYPFLFPISLAVVFSFGLGPLVDQLQSKSKRSRWIATGYVFFGAAFFTFIFSHAIQRLYSMLFGKDRESAMEVLMALKNRVVDSLDSLLPFIKDLSNTYPSLNLESLQSLLHSNVEKGLSFAAGFVAATLTSLPEILLYLMTFFIFLAILVAKRKHIYVALRNADLVDNQDLILLTRWAQESSFKMIYVNVVVGFVQGLILTIASAAVGFPEWSIIFALVFCASFFPLVGTAPIAVFLVLLAYSSLGVTSALVLAGAGALTGVIDNIVRSLLVSNDKNGLNSWVTLIGIIGAIAVFGFSGIFLGPFILSFTVRLWPRLQKIVLDFGAPSKEAPKV